MAGYRNYKTTYRKMSASGGFRHVKERDINRAKRFIVDHGINEVQRMFGLNIPESVEIALNDMGYVVEAGVILSYDEWYEWYYGDEDIDE